MVIIKDCINNLYWICFADNGGNGFLAIDLDPGDEGTHGQVIALYEDGVEYIANSFKQFMGSTLSEIETGELIWDEGGIFIPKEEADIESDKQNQVYYASIIKIKEIWRQTMKNEPIWIFDRKQCKWILMQEKQS